MALTYGFFDAELVGNDQYDRVYSADDFAEYFSLFVANGIFGSPSNQMQVVASTTPDMNINIMDGFGWVNGWYAKNKGLYPLAIQAASGTSNRVDAIVLRWRRAQRDFEFAVVQGTPGVSPVAPAVTRTEDIYELMLATVTIPSGATNIPNSAITDRRPDDAVCGWVHGLVDQINTTELFAQYDDTFWTWFNALQEALAGDVATNLQNQITAVSNRVTDLETWKSTASSTLLSHTESINNLSTDINITAATKALYGLGTTSKLNDLLAKVPTAEMIYRMTNAAGALAASGLATGDLFPLYDVSATTGKKVTLENLVNYFKGQSIATGSYVGTGTYGVSNPCSLTFDFSPKLVLIFHTRNNYGSYSTLETTMLYPLAQVKVRTSGSLGIALTWGDNSVQWYCTTSNTVPENQLNGTEYTYNYIALG